MQPNTRSFAGASSRFGSSFTSGKFTCGRGRQRPMHPGDSFVFLHTSASHPAVFLTQIDAEQSGRSSSAATPFIHAHVLSEDWEATSTGEVDQPVPANKQKCAPGGFNA